MINKNILKIISISLSATIFSSCATIVSDSDYVVQVNSNPSNSNFKVTNASGVVVHSGTTPASISLSAKKGFFSGAKYNIVFEKPGFATQTVPVHADIDGWYIGNLLFGGFIGFLIVDPLTGAMWKLDPVANASLSKTISKIESNDVKQLHILSVDQIPQNLKGNLIALK